MRGINELAAARTRPAWQSTLLGIALLVIATLWLYRDTAARLVELWGQSETFAHGYIVPFIALWLIWRQRAVLAAIAPGFAPAPTALLALAGVAIAWFAGDLADVNPVRQFALIGFIALTVPALAGWQAARLLLFPLCFLFFAVPFGEFLLPWLMARTADFTVLALRASGIPVYRDGLQFVIPSGTWSVVEACSGVRYLIASLMVGALFAYLNYRSTRRRLLFMLVALVVPIVANWVRAYMIVMIGHLSSNKLATGVDHLIYGWVFFGVVVGLMFLIGSRWAEPSFEVTSVVPAPDKAAQPSGSAFWAMTAAAVVVLALPILLLRALDASQGRSTPQLAEPRIAGVAADGDSTLPAWTPAFANPSASLARRYQFRGHSVGMYIGYYRGQGTGRKLVSSSNTLVHSGDPAWAQVDAGSRSVQMGPHDLIVRTARLRRPVSSSDSTTLALRQIYWVDGRFEASDTRAKAWGAWSRLSGRGDDGAVIIVYTSEQEPGDADAVLDGMLLELLPAIELVLKKTRDGD